MREPWGAMDGLLGRRPTNCLVVQVCLPVTDLGCQLPGGSFHHPFWSLLGPYFIQYIGSLFLSSQVPMSLSVGHSAGVASCHWPWLVAHFTTGTRSFHGIPSRHFTISCNPTWPPPPISPPMPPQKWYVLKSAIKFTIYFLNKLVKLWEASSLQNWYNFDPTSAPSSSLS